MIDLTQLAESLQDVDYPAFRNLASANELFREIYNGSMAATADYLTSYTAVQTFDNSGVETTDSIRKRNALGTVFKDLKSIADRYDTIVATAKSVYFTLTTTPGLLFSNVLTNKSACLYLSGKYLHLDTNGSSVRAHPAAIRGNFYTNVEYNARRSENANPGLDASGWSLATHFFEYSVNAQNGAILQYPRRIYIIIRARGDISTTSGAFDILVCVDGKSSAPFIWRSSTIPCTTSDYMENVLNAMNTLILYYNKHIDGMLVYAPGTIGDFWSPIGNCTITHRTDLGLVSIDDSSFTWDLSLQESQSILPEDTTMLKDAEAREGLIRSFMRWASQQ